MCLFDFYSKIFSTLLFKFQIQNLDNIPETSKKIRKSKEKIKKELEDSTINCERHENKELEEKAAKVEKTEDEAVVI